MPTTTTAVKKADRQADALYTRRRACVLVGLALTSIGMLAIPCGATSDPIPVPQPGPGPTDPVPKPSDPRPVPPLPNPPPPAPGPSPTPTPNPVPPP